MPRPVIPAECKKMRTLEVNITKTTQEDIMEHMEEQFNKFCAEASEIKQKQTEFLDYIYDNAYKGFSWRTKKPKHYEWEEWMGDKVSHYNSMIMKHFDYKYDLKLCLEAFNTDPEFDIEMDALYFEVHNKNVYDLDVPFYFKMIEAERYKESEEAWKIKDADWIRTEAEKSIHKAKHHSLEQITANYEEDKKYWESDDIFQRRDPNYLTEKYPTLRSTRDSGCKYCVKEIEDEKQRAIREIENEKQFEESERKWKEQKELERKEALKSRNMYRCPECDFETYDEYAFEKHEETKSHKKLTELRKYFCQDCEVQCRNQMEYNIHTQTKKHKIKIGEIEKQTEFKCEPCDYITQLKQNYDKHILTKGHIEKTK
jgi:hypothetical protein